MIYLISVASYNENIKNYVLFDDDLWKQFLFDVKKVTDKSCVDSNIVFQFICSVHSDQCSIVMHYWTMIYETSILFRPL